MRIYQMAFVILTTSGAFSLGLGLGGRIFRDQKAPSLFYYIMALCALVFFGAGAVLAGTIP